MAGGALLPGWLLWSLPAMFLLHDAEEVLFLPPWLRRNRESVSYTHLTLPTILRV